MAHVEFVPTSVYLFFKVGKEGLNKSIGGKIRLKGWQSVKLATEEDLNKLEGKLIVFQATDEGENQTPIGYISYWGEYEVPEQHSPASYTVDVTIPTTVFDDLVTEVSRGKMPSEICIEVDGMKYDSQPDGSGKGWDNKASKELPIDNISFVSSLIGAETGADTRDSLDDMSPPEDSMPPSRAQLNQVTSSLNDLKSKMESVRSELSWLIILVGIIFATFLWRFG